MFYSKTSLRALALVTTSLLFGLAAAGCDDDTTGTGGSGGTTASGGAGGTGTGGAGGTGGSTATYDYSTPEKILAALDGKTLVMAGDDIPTDPNGYNENYNFGQATQCYHQVTMTPTAAVWHVASELGTLNDAPNTGDMGTCDRTTKSADVAFDSTAILIENVTGTCFDFTATYVGFGQEGRGKLTVDDAGTITSIDLELYFGGQAVGHRCADGAVGAATVKIKGNDFAGDAVQTYKVN